MPISVLLVDDSQIVRKVVRDYLETLTDWKIKGEARDGAEAIQKARELKPDVILLDYSMPNMNGIQAASELKKLLPNVFIVVFTMFDESLGSILSSAAGVDLVRRTLISGASLWTSSKKSSSCGAPESAGRWPPSSTPMARFRAMKARACWCAKMARSPARLAAGASRRKSGPPRKK